MPGLLFIVFGILYLVKPDFFRSGIWRKKEVASNVISPEAYIKYKRVLGVVFILAGTIWLLFDLGVF